MPDPEILQPSMALATRLSGCGFATSVTGVRIEPLPSHGELRISAERALQRLFHTVFAHEISPETWSWKYHEAPGGQALNLAALDRHGWEDPCGHVGCLVLPGRWQGRPVRMAHLTDVMVHPRSRGGLELNSVYGRMMRAMAECLSDLDTPSWPIFAYGFPGRIPSRLGQRMGLYRPILPDESQPVWTHHPFHSGSSGQTGAGVRRADLLSRSLRWLRDVPWVEPLAIQSGAHDWPTGIQAGRVGMKDGQPNLVKNSAYLDWRYRRHPVRRYGLWSVKGRMGRPRGWLVTGGHQENWVIDAGLPTEWSQGPGWLSVLQALSARTGLAQWQSWLPSCAPHDEVQTSLIVPGEFRFRDITGRPRWVQGDSDEAGADCVPDPRFQPGDTDVF